MHPGPDCKATAEDTAGGLSAFELAVPARGGPGLHVHHREDEWYYVVEGTFLFDAGDERHELRTGASIFLPRDISHRWANSSTSGQGRLLLVNQPGGFEKFFDELGKLPRNMTDADMKVMDELAGRFGMEMLGPPIFT
jgi:quercetin 2,3-dioxygenase